MVLDDNSGWIMKVLVCGDRDWTNRQAIRLWLQVLKEIGYTDLIEGEARGADRLFREEGEKLGYVIYPYPAEWGKYHRGAGPIRNRQMLDQKPDLVLAFHTDLKNSKGTADTVREARRRGIQVIADKGGDDGEPNNPSQVKG